MKLLNEGEQNDTQVTWEDQNNINQFSKLNIRLESLDVSYQQKKTEKEYLEDLVNELELADEDEYVRYRIGDCFVSLPLSACQERIERDQSKLDQELEEYTDQIDSINKEMAKLKAILYGKFGNTINLEKE